MKTYKIILVDDDIISLALVTKILKSTGKFDSIETYKNGKEAFDALSLIYEKNENYPNLLLLDINMPVWDGWDLLDEMNKNNFAKKFKIVMLSSSDHLSDIDKSKKYDLVDGFITKPITIDKIISFINK